MATATRGPDDSDNAELPSSETAAVKEVLPNEATPFDFFIFPNIPCSRGDRYFGSKRKCVSFVILRALGG
jgi:hypothetical protein